MSKDKAIDTLNNTVPSSNRLTAQFNRVKKKDNDKGVDLKEVNDSIEKNLYISTKATSDEADEMDYTLKRMNKMGRSSSKLLKAIYPELRHDKVKPKKPTFSAVSFPIVGFGALMAAPAAVNKFTDFIKNKPKPKKLSEEGDPDNIFGLTSNDKNKLKQMQEKTGDQSATMDKVIRVASGGLIPSIAGLIFNFQTYYNSGIYNIFKEQLEMFQNGSVEIFTKIFKGIMSWIKENLYDPLTAPGKMISQAWNKLKTKAINILNRMFKLEASASILNKDEPVKGYSANLVGSLRSMVLSYLGNSNEESDSSLDTFSNKKSKIDKFRDGAQELAESLSDYSGEDNFDTGEEFQGLPKGSSLNTTSGMQLGIYSGLRRAGFNDNQSRILTAEIGREGSYLAKNVFGVHGDPANGSGNLGMISWQKDRFGKLVKWMQSAGLMKGRTMQASQASIDMQAKFIMHEIRNDPRYKRTKKLFLENPNVTYSVAKEVLGTNYIRWRYTDSKYSSGHRNRDAAYAKINKQLKEQQQGGMGDMSWTYNSPAEDSVNIKNFAKIQSDVKPIQQATYISPQINTNNNSNAKSIKRSSITKNYSQASTFIPNKKEQFTDKNIQRSFIPQQRQQTSSTSSSVSSSSKRSKGTKPIKSFFEYLMEKDLSGNMF